jgi:hypothetical protein
MRKNYIVALLIGLFLGSFSSAGEVGRVIGRLAHLENLEIEGFRPEAVSIVNESVCLTSDLGKDRSFVFPAVPPGRYFLIIGKGHVVQTDFDVDLDLTTKLTFDFADPKTRYRILNYPRGMHQVGDRIFMMVPYRSSPRVHPDKTFSGRTILGEEELRARLKTMSYYEIAKKAKLGGYLWVP